MYWGVGGWLLTPFLQKAGFEKMIELQTRVANEITTTFKSEYTAEVSLAETVSLAAITQYGKQATGTKYLINPNK
jgi:NADPH2:quinone reductase